MPPKDGPSLYSVAKTTMWFAIVSIVLLLSLIWTVYADYAREWKTWQRKFIQLKTEKVAAELKQVEAKVDKAKLETLQKQHAEAESEMKMQKKEVRKLEKEIEKLDLDAQQAKTKSQDLKQFFDSKKYFYEEARHKHEKGAEKLGAELAKIEADMAAAKINLENLEAAKAEKEQALAVYKKKAVDLDDQIKALLLEKSRAERKLKSVKPTIVTEILNAPMLDFIAPTLRIQQVVLEDLYDDYHFTKVQKVDRCTTCHLGIDQKGFENAPQPFKTHPKLDLFLGSTSPHPLETIGCTVCHGGNGHSVGFVDSAHMPRSEEQKKEWKKKYNWRSLAKWEPKMLPMNHVESSCTKCHRGVLEVPQADKLNEGRKLAETFGCFGCHKVAGFENMWKAGPDLTNVQTKLSKEWIVKWLQDPKVFRASTKMPQIFHLANTNTPEDRERNLAAIESVAAYLMKNSEQVPLTKPAAQGNAQNGEKLIKEVGCLGCHTAGGVNVNDHGPELTGLGSKVSPDWLFTWLKNPKHYSKDTRMPNLRLTDQEAADIAAYLLSQKSDAFDQLQVPQARPEVVDELVLTNLQKNLRLTEAQAELGKMSPDQKMEFLGKQTIGFQGCYACHSIKGFEEGKPIGTELTKEGQKDVHMLDFGLIHIEHERHAWFFQKLKEPRIFDEGKVRTYYEKLRMPHFGFTDEEAERLTTFLLSLTQDPIPLSMQRRLGERDKEVEAGRWIVAKFNCQGCHTLDGREGKIRTIFDDQGAAPPIIDGEGAKVQEKWLHEFLKEPTTIRPWLTYRMPTFDFNDEQAATLVRYFAGLSKKEISYQGAQIPESTPEMLETGKMLFEKFQCIKCHKIDKTSMAMGASFLAPDLAMTKHRLKPDWVLDWIKDPQALQEGTMMPGFFPEGQSPLPDVLGGDAGAQIKAIRDYLFRFAPGQTQEDKQKNPVAKEGPIS